MPYLFGNSNKSSIETNNTITPINLKIAPNKLTSEINQQFTNTFDTLSNDTFKSINWDTQYRSSDINNFTANNLVISNGYFEDDTVYVSYIFDENVFKLDKANDTLIINYLKLLAKQFG